MGSFWQVMRVSRNRYWGNPSLVAFIERLADSGKSVGWNGLLIGDIATAWRADAQQTLESIGRQRRSVTGQAVAKLWRKVEQNTQWPAPYNWMSWWSTGTAGS
jgi:hypothetical protein